MAEKALFSIAAGITQILGSLAKEELVLLLGVEDELEKLKNTVSTIEAVLLDAEKQQQGSHAVKIWLAQLEDILYDADDLLDDISNKALQREAMKDKKGRKVRMLFSKPKQLAYGFKISHKIKAIRNRLDVVAANRKFHLQEGRVEAHVRDRERDDTYSFVHSKDIIGRDDDKEAVIRLLKCSNVEDNVSVVSIVGIGGLGKTTLAKLIFNDVSLPKYELKIWLCVSDNFMVKNIVEMILESITGKKPKSKKMNLLVNDLQQAINGRMYFIVLDDVWNEDQSKWLELKDLLRGGKEASQILVTTRDKKVSNIMSTMEPYELRGLDQEVSWHLFEQVAFRNKQDLEDTYIVEMGKKILAKCVGVPLAIKTIGRLLFFEDPKTKWLSFINNELTKISQKENDILPTLKLSYDHLPYYLKQCFTYCSLFPKDHKIDKSLLINLWIAQGFVKPMERNQCLEDIGDDYFMNLLWGSFFQEPMEDEFGNVSCKMHDLMHDLATQVAGPLITIIDDKKKNIDRKTRHVSISEEIPISLYEVSGIRTLFNPYKWNRVVDYREIFRKFKSLRSLNLNCNNKYVPSSIGELRHLRYLNLSENSIRKLPNAITQLQNLQMLKLSYCDELEELPRNIKVLVNLRHLDLLDCRSLKYMPHGLSQLTNLRTLSRFVVDSRKFSRRGGRLNELKELNNLRGQLSIKGLRHGKDYVSEYKAANLKEKLHLHTLELSWEWQRDIEDIVGNEMSIEGLKPQQNLKKLSIEGYWGSRLPTWLWSLTNLVILILECPRCQYLPPLSRLPWLKDLTLKLLAGMKDISDCSDRGDIYKLPSSSSSSVPFFPSLEKLSLINCESVEWCWLRTDSSGGINDSVEEASMAESLLVPSFPRLSMLRIWACPRLTSMPIFPHVEFLELNGNLKLLNQMSRMNISTTIASSMLATSSSISLPKLKRLILNSIQELETLQGEPLQNLVSLEILEIKFCHNLKSLFGIQYLTAVKDLVIYECLGFGTADDEDWMQGPCLKNLLFLEFSYLPKLASLPLCLQHATSLQKLAIYGCEHLTAVPEWFPSCTASLQSLEIYNCPILMETCKRGKGEDWPKIAHIPNLTFV